MKNVLIGIILAGATITVHQLVSEQQGLEITSFLLVLKARYIMDLPL